MIAAGMSGAKTTPAIAQLAALLKDNQSSYVRSISTQHLDGGIN